MLENKLVLELRNIDMILNFLDYFYRKPGKWNQPSSKMERGMSAQNSLALCQANQPALYR